METALLQTLAPQAVTGALEVQHLHLRTSTIDKYKQLSAGGILVQLLLGQYRQTIEGFAHIRRQGIEPDPHARVRDPHRCEISAPAQTHHDACAEFKFQLPAIGTVFL